MLKLLTLALAVSTAAASLTWTAATTNNILTSDYATVTLVSKGDFAYSTIYNSGQDTVKGKKWLYE